MNQTSDIGPNIITCTPNSMKIMVNRKIKSQIQLSLSDFYRYNFKDTKLYKKSIDTDSVLDYFFILSV